MNRIDEIAFLDEPDETGLSLSEVRRVVRLAKQHAEATARCKRALVQDFDTPAPRTINIWCAETGLTRLDWEKLIAVENNWPYEAPPAKLLLRWASL